jgi:hypothetical protein
VLWNPYNNETHDDDAIMQYDGIIAEINYNYINGILGKSIKELYEKIII